MGRSWSLSARGLGGRARLQSLALGGCPDLKERPAYDASGLGLPPHKPWHVSMAGPACKHPHVASPRTTTGPHDMGTTRRLQFGQPPKPFEAKTLRQAKGTFPWG